MKLLRGGHLNLLKMYKLNVPSKVKENMDMNKGKYIIENIHGRSVSQ